MQIVIEGLFETHVEVAELERSMSFYGNELGLSLGHLDQERRAAFFWVGGRGSAMLGLWEKSAAEIRSRHFAFRSSVDDIVGRSNRWLMDRGLQGFSMLNDGQGRPMVFAWMPAVAIYFLDPDGHLLELIAMLDDKPDPGMGIVSWEVWRESATNSEAVASEESA